MEIGGDECDNLNFMSFRNDNVIIHEKNREFQEIVKFVKFDFSIYAVVCARVIQKTQCPTTSTASSVPRTEITTNGPSALAPRSTRPPGGTGSAPSPTLTANTSRSHNFELTQNHVNRNFID